MICRLSWFPRINVILSGYRTCNSKLQILEIGPTNKQCYHYTLQQQSNAEPEASTVKTDHAFLFSFWTSLHTVLPCTIPLTSSSLLLCLVFMHGLLIMTVFLCMCDGVRTSYMCVCVCVGVCFTCLSVSQILAGTGTAHPAKCKLITGCCVE